MTGPTDNERKTLGSIVAVSEQRRIQDESKSEKEKSPRAYAREIRRTSASSFSIKFPAVWKQVPRVVVARTRESEDVCVCA